MKSLFGKETTWDHGVVWIGNYRDLLIPFLLEIVLSWLISLKQSSLLKIIVYDENWLRRRLNAP